MPNRWPKCEICLYRHAPGRCKGKRGKSEIGAGMAIQWQSIPQIVQDLTSSISNLIDMVERMPGASAFLAPGTAGAEYVAQAKHALRRAGAGR